MEYLRPGFRQSPAGLALLLGRFAQAGFYRVRDGVPVAQSYPHPEQVKHTVEQLIAWTAAALVYGAAAGDDDDDDKPVLITGSVPYKNPGDHALDVRLGREPFTLRVGHVSIPYGRIEPAATVLGTTVDLIQAAKRGRHQTEIFDAIGSLMESVGQQAEQKTFLRGIGDLVSSVQGARRGERENYLANFLASWVPNLIRQPLRQLDPYVREHGGGFAERLAANVVPQLAEPKIDAYGEKVAAPGLAAWRALVPVNVRTSPEVIRVDRLLANWNRHADPHHPNDAERPWAPHPLSRAIVVNRHPRQLTGPELRDYATRTGRMAAQILRGAGLNVEHPTAADLKRVQTAFATAGTIVRRQMFGATAAEIASP